MLRSAAVDGVWRLLWPLQTRSATGKQKTKRSGGKRRASQSAGNGKGKRKGERAKRQRRRQLWAHWQSVLASSFCRQLAACARPHTYTICERLAKACLEGQLADASCLQATEPPEDKDDGVTRRIYFAKASTRARPCALMCMLWFG